MSECTHNKAYSFIMCHQTIRMIISKPFHDSQLLADSSQNKCQFLSSLDFGQFYKCGSCSLKHTISSIFFGYHLIEDTHSYPHLWKFPENILKYLYGGTFEKCKLFIETHCISLMTWCYKPSTSCQETNNKKIYVYERAELATFENVCIYTFPNQSLKWKRIANTTKH